MARKPERVTTQGDLLTVAQVAAYLQLNRLTVYRYIREGRLEAVRMGRTIRVRRVDVQRFLEAQRVVPKGAAPSRPVAQPGQPAPSSLERGSARRPHPVTSPVKHSDEIYVGPPREEQSPSREAVVTPSPLDWVIRGLH
ncbi:MAG: excisionase family DNA-binding protein [Armatimonadota bacterium]|nr:excisionase family DNA-binding protein [Armatimonadota bacterium]MDR7459703.1 excisionase family DNA-binding protein [Armatimonadota bacterium]MDR7478295.1 excisionase family DNA-binding protein [Armatimonadota bacterium]MDR7487262.1 excisionase family DNA-binding protein [Armatimonadota bacterium]MDR7501187.1 excisionase family DNA-binding protein [Armatimonadota bacterium]